MGLASAAFGLTPGGPDGAQVTPWDLQSGDRFGSDLAVSDQWLMVGSPGDDLTGRDSGSVAAFERVEGAWQQRDILAPTDGKPGEYFGTCLAISDNLCAIGAPWDGVRGTRSGAVYLFQWDGRFWKQIHKLHA